MDLTFAYLCMLYKTLFLLLIVGDDLNSFWSSDIIMTSMLWDIYMLVFYVIPVEEGIVRQKLFFFSKFTQFYVETKGDKMRQDDWCNGDDIL